LATEYEQLLTEMLNQRREALQALKAQKGKNDKKILSLESEINFMEVELERYQRGMNLFRSKGIPKVGRWGHPETGQTGQGAA